MSSLAFIKLLIKKFKVNKKETGLASLDFVLVSFLLILTRFSRNRLI